MTWLGINETLRNATGEQTLSDPFSQIKNSWFDQISATGLEYVRTEPAQQVFNAWVSVLFSENSGWNTVKWHEYTPLITAYEEVRVNNVGIGPQGLTWTRGGRAFDRCLFRGKNNAVFRLAGLFMCGNAIFDKSIAHTQNGTYPMPTVWDQDDYKINMALPVISYQWMDRTSAKT